MDTDMDMGMENENEITELGEYVTGELLEYAPYEKTPRLIEGLCHLLHTLNDLYNVTSSEKATLLEEKTIVKLTEIVDAIEP